MPKTSYLVAVAGGMWRLVFVIFGSTRCPTQEQNLATGTHFAHFSRLIIFNFSVFVEEQLPGLSVCSTTAYDAVSTSSVA